LAQAANDIAAETGLKHRLVADGRRVAAASWIDPPCIFNCYQYNC
jgi:hypothetical protein